MIRHRDNTNRNAARRSGPAAPSYDAMQALRSSLVFAPMPALAQRRATDAMQWHRFEAGAEMLPAHPGGGEIFVLAAGRADVVSRQNAANRLVRTTLGPGDLFGAFAAFDGDDRSSTVVAKTVCLAGSMPSATFLGLVGEHRDVALAMLRHQVRELRAANRRIDSLAGMDARARLAFELDRLSEVDPGDNTRRQIHPVPTQAQIAANVGLGRQTVARLFGELKRAGIIRRRGSTLKILAPRDLKRIFENRDHPRDADQNEPK